MHQFTPIPEFDQLAAMAQNNPAQLEALRREMIEETISFADESMQRKLRGLQFHIDMEIRRSKSPLSACLKISEMMHGSLSDLRSALNNKTAEKTGAAVFTTRVRDIASDDYAAPAPQSAKVLAFRAR